MHSDFFGMLISGFVMICLVMFFIWLVITYPFFLLWVVGIVGGITFIVWPALKDQWNSE